MGRQERNDELRDWRELKELIAELDPLIVPVLLRSTIDADLRQQIKVPKGDREHGTPPPHYSDPTGDAATSFEVLDRVENSVKAMSGYIHLALNSAKSILSDEPVDVATRAKQTVPNCSACGDLIVGKIFYGRWDDKCRKRFARWVDDGHAPDEKLVFEIMVRGSRKNDVHQS